MSIVIHNYLSARRPARDAERKITRALLEGIVGSADIQQHSGGAWTFRRGFFYTHGYTAERYAADIMQKLQAAGLNPKLLGSGEVWKSFKGGASIRAQSHWWVKVQF